MVGVPGRSKGCHTCRKRKIKCDEGRPNCDRCTKAGYKCAGYDRETIFRNHAAAPGPSGASRAVLPNRASTVSLNTEAVIPNELSVVAFKEDMQYAYLFDNFVWNNYAMPWLQLSAQGKLGGLASSAVQAFSQTVFGKHHHLNEIRNSGAVCYGKAVRSLIVELSTPEKEGTAELLIPILILLLHASSESDFQASVSHMDGMVKILQVCGPERFQLPPLRQAFESCRGTLVIASLMQKQRLFLEQPSWLTVPWAISPFEKNDQNWLCDILATVPGLLEDETDAEASGSLQAKEYIISRVQNQLHKLYQWRWDWEARNPCAAWEVDPAEVWRPQLLHHSRPFPTVLRFSSFAAATEIALYNTVLLCLLGLLWMHQRQGHSPALEGNQHSGWHAPCSGPLNLPNNQLSVRKAAVEICRAFEFQLLSVTKNDSALFWLFPIGMANMVLQEEPQYTAWISHMLNMSDYTRGYGTGRNMFGFGFYRFRNMLRQFTTRSYSC